MLTTLIEPLAMALDATTLHKARRVSKTWRDACACAWAALTALICELRSLPPVWTPIPRKQWMIRTRTTMLHQFFDREEFIVMAADDVIDGYKVLETGELTPFHGTLIPTHMRIVDIYWHGRPCVHEDLDLLLDAQTTAIYHTIMVLRGKISYVATNEFARHTEIERVLVFPDSHDPRCAYLVVLPDADQPMHVCRVDVERGVGVWMCIKYREGVDAGFALVRPGTLTLCPAGQAAPRTIEF